MYETGPTLGEYEVVEVSRQCSLEGKRVCFSSEMEPKSFDK